MFIGFINTADDCVTINIDHIMLMEPSPGSIEVTNITLVTGERLRVKAEYDKIMDLLDQKSKFSMV